MFTTPEPLHPDLPNPEPKKPISRKRHLIFSFQYSLRSLMVVITLLCIWLGYISNEARKQKAAVEQVEEMGGEVAYNYRYDKGGRFIEMQPSGPKWLREWIGVDYLCSVKWIFLSYKPSVSDLSPLEDLTDLEELNLCSTEVTDISPLVGLTNLEYLDLRGTEVTDLSPLKSLTKLEYLFLNETPVKDLSPLENLTKLKSLFLRLTKVTDLSPLERLTDLEFLELQGTQVTDLSPLKSMTNLQVLALRGTLATEKDVQELQKALPNCKIEWDPYPAFK